MFCRIWKFKTRSFRGKNLEAVLWPWDELSPTQIWLEKYKKWTIKTKPYMIYTSIDSIFYEEFKKIYFKVIWGHIKVIKRSNLEYLLKYLHYTYISTSNSMEKLNSGSNRVDSGVKRSFEVILGSNQGQIVNTYHNTCIIHIFRRQIRWRNSIRGQIE